MKSKKFPSRPRLDLVMSVTRSFFASLQKQIDFFLEQHPKIKFPMKLELTNSVHFHDVSMVVKSISVSYTNTLLNPLSHAIS